MNINDFILAGKLTGSGGGGGGSSLPSVTSADAGKVLAVNASGEWAAEQKIAYINRSDSDVLDKTWNEINTLMRNGVICYIRQIGEDVISCDIILVCSTLGLFVTTAVGEAYVADNADAYPVLD